jgi:hypothetical protein
METIDLTTGLPTLSVCDQDKDMTIAYSDSRKQWGLVPLRFMSNAGYACRRWSLTAASPVGEAVGNIDYLRMLPDLLGLGCYLVGDDHTRTKLNANNHYQDTSSTTVKLDGSQGQYMWGWDKEWYYAWWIDGSYLYEAASLSPISGRLNYKIPVASVSALGGGVMDRTNNKLASVISDDAQYRGGKNDSDCQAKDGTFATLLGRFATNETHGVYEAAALRRGAGWGANWYGHWSAIGILWRIIFGTRNVQAAVNADKDSNGLWQGGLGSGVTNVGSWWNGKFGNYPFLPTSVGVEMGDGCGAVSYTVKDDDDTVLGEVSVPVFFGLKNCFGYINRWLGGLLISYDANGLGHVFVNRKFLTANNTPNTTSGLLEVGTVPTVAATGWYYIKELSMQNLCGMPSAIGGSTSTYYCDGVYLTNAVSSLRRPHVGGRADNGGSAGSCCSSANNGVSAAYACYGAPLCEAAAEWDTTPTLAE